MNMTTIRTVLSIAAHRNWEIHQMDVKSGYLNAELHDNIYMCAPPGYLKSEDLGKVLKLLQSLYGLKQAGFEWSEELEKFFLDAEYTRSQVDQAVYFHRISDEHTVITVSVDDMAITSKHLQHILHFKAKLCKRYLVIRTKSRAQPECKHHFLIAAGVCRNSHRMLMRHRYPIQV
jgi:hypothetical protein